MSLDGVLTKEFIFEEFKKCETNADKVKYLKELKETKINHPKVISKPSQNHSKFIPK